MKKGDIIFEVYDCEKHKQLYMGSYEQCQKFVNAICGFDAFIGGENWTQYKIHAWGVFKE